MKFNNIKIGTKLYSGFFIASSLTLLVGVIAYIGISRIVYQLEISKIVNRIIVDAGDTQAHSLRNIIYGDQQYYLSAQKEIENIKTQSDEVKALMLSKSNREIAENIRQHITFYENDIVEFQQLQQSLETNYNPKREKNASDLLRNIINVVEATKIYSRAHKGDYSAVERVFIAQEGRNAVNRINLKVYRYILKPTGDAEKAIIDEFNYVEDLLNRAYGMMASKVTKKAIEDALSAHADYKREFETYKSVLDRQAKIQANQRKNAGALLSEARNLRGGVYSYIDKTENSVYSLVPIVVFLSVIFGMLLAILITKSITHPLSGCVKMVEWLD